ncbi:phosphopantetheine-binding protein [Saccharopolyspora sp. 5N102]|uniref:phosphopantetheine-binding protein n=1 Tax=Saccharopolyspora sp. 5N102 TaxID=3375155 RepID=UPI0037A1CD1C
MSRTAADDARGGEEPASLPQRLASASRHEQDRLLLESVRTQVAEVLGHPSPEAVDPGQTFLAMGLDSVTAVQLRNGLGAVIGQRLPATVVFDYPTTTELVAFLRTRLVKDDPAPAVKALLEIDGLEKALADGSYGPEERRAIAARLADLAGSLGAAAAESDVDGNGVRDLESADIGEMFDILDSELDTP